MKLDVTMLEKDILKVSGLAHAVEQAGHDCLWATESGSDPFLQAHACIRATTSTSVGTAIAVAFARTPMTVAYSAWDLSRASEGRFILGLGTQVKAHIERRYSMPWSKPVSRMDDFIQALKAIWESWRTGDDLAYEGAFYHHSLMSPFWRPHPHPHEIPLFLAAVGPLMTQLAGARCDGLLGHAFTNRAYLEAQTFPALDRGLASANRSQSEIDVLLPIIMVMGDTDEEIAKRRAMASEQLAFYGSTPAYRPVLDAIGYGDLQTALTGLSKQNQWGQMSRLIDDEVLSAFTITGTPEQMPKLAREHLSERVTRTSSYFGWPISDPDRLRSIVREFHQQ